MATAIICEFNPFHNGHKYLVQTAKKLTGENVIAIMSGAYTQRGEIAITDKYSRAKTALENGADLVLELPTVYAVSNAQRFATCGVEIARSFSCVNSLSFGCENDNKELLLTASNALENDEVKAVIKAEMEKGSYFPRAAETAVRQVFSDGVADVYKKPNNILAMEYIKALNGSHIEPLPIKRIAVEHDSKDINNKFASASKIREMLRDNQKIDNLVPKAPDKITYPQKLETAILYKLRSMSVDDFALLPDVGEGLENRIYTAVNSYNSVEEIIDGIKTKRYTHSRIRRIITSAFLGITEELQNTPIEYVRVLGFTKNGADLLKTCKINIVTSANDGIKLGGNTEKLLKKDIYATDVSALAYDPTMKKGMDYITPIIKIL